MNDDVQRVANEMGFSALINKYAEKMRRTEHCWKRVLSGQLPADTPAEMIRGAYIGFQDCAKMARCASGDPSVIAEEFCTAYEPHAKKAMRDKIRQQCGRNPPPEVVDECWEFFSDQLLECADEQ